MSEDLLTVSALLNRRVYLPQKRKEDTYRRIGKVRRFVFHPTEKRVVGIIVKRPDAALMFHRHDLFVAIDRVRVVEEGLIAQDAPDSFDAKACRRLGLDWDRCLLWLGMPLVTEGGEALGRVGDVSFEPVTGRVVSLRRDEGATARLLLGVERIPVEMLRGFQHGVGAQMASYHEGREAGEATGAAKSANSSLGAMGAADSADFEDSATSAHIERTERVEQSEEAEDYGALVVSDAVLELNAEGGLAEIAGAATARAAQKGKRALGKAREAGVDAAVRTKEAAKEAAAPAMEHLGEAAEGALAKGAYATGRQLGRARGMFSEFASEYRKALKGEDDS